MENHHHDHVTEQVDEFSGWSYVKTNVAELMNPVAGSAEPRQNKFVFPRGTDRLTCCRFEAPCCYDNNVVC
jgi:hypothetical protein